MSDYTIRRADPSELPGLHRLMMTVYRALPDPETEAWRPAAELLRACAADMRKDGEGADDG